MLVQKIVDFTGHITCGHKKDAEFVSDIFFDPINDLDPEKNMWTYIYSMEAVCVERLKNY